MKLLGTADVLIRAITDKFNKDIDKSEKKVKGFAGRSSKALSGLSKSFVSLAGPAGVAALTASLAGVVAVGAKFEKQMATVRGIARASEKDFKLLSDAAKEMGATTEWSATQSAEALEFMALAGWNVQKSIEGLPLMLDAATAAGTNLAETSDILTDTLTAMGLKIEDMDRLTDVMIGTTTRANTSFLQMGEALKEAAPYAKAYGFEIEEVAALLGIVADAGIKASDAGTGLKNTWINNAKAAKLLGTDATDLIGTLRAANRAQWDTNQFAKVYGKIAGKTVLNIAAQIDKYEALAETLHDVSGETKELADIKLDTLIGDWKLLKSAVEGLGGVIYEEIVDPLRAATSATATFVTDLSLSWQAMKLNLSGVIDFKTAMLDGAAAVKLFNEEMGPKKTRLAYLERIIASGKYTWQVEKEAKALRALIATQKKAAEIVKDKDIEKKEKKERKVDDSWIKSMQAQEKFALEMSESEQERLNKRYELEQEINAKIHDELLSDTNFRLQELDSQFLAYDGFVQDKAALDRWYIKQYEEIMASKEQYDIDSYSKMTEAEKSWIDGLKTGLDDYANTASDVYGNIKDVAVGALTGMEDALVEFCMTGKLNFKQFANSIIKDLIRILIQKQITGAIAGAVGGMFGGGAAAITPMGGTGAGSTTGMTPTTPVMAKGGIFNSGISSHSNAIIDSPTFFSFAKGQGLMGEAGPEAIMPLTRLPGGDLGVKTESNKTTPPVMTVNIHEAPGTQTRVERSEDGQNLNIIIEQVEQAMTGRMERGTGMAPFMDGRYGRAY